MPNTYLKNKIRNYGIYNTIIIIILIFSAFIAGRYFLFEGSLNLVVGAVLGVMGGVILYIIEHHISRQASFSKGLKLEMQIEAKLKKLKIEYTPHIETDYGDLDFLIEKGVQYYGIEAKNWSGGVKFENGLLKVANWECNHILRELLQHCLLARNKEFGEDSNNFIKPVLVFGYKADVYIPQNKIMFNNREIIVATIQDFEQHIK